MEAKDTKLNVHRIGWLVFVIGASVATPLQAQLDISDNALEAIPPVNPNIFLLNDDSGSMDWEVITQDADNEFRFSANQPDGSNNASAGSVTHRDSDDDGTAECDFTQGDGSTYDGYVYGVEFGSNQYGDNANDCNTADDEAWRFRNSDFNKVYFNPAQTYVPWAGVDSDGDPFDDIDPENAPNNPYNPTETVNLLTDNSDWDGGTTRLQSDRDGDGNSDGFRFYTWTDDGDGTFENGEETEYQVGNMDSTDLANLNSYLTTRYGSDAKQYATVEDVQENFANWFGYYRSRELAAKAALSRVVRDATSARIGYGTINGSVSGREVATMNVSAGSGEKQGLLDQLYQTNSSGGTPLRTNLRDVGRYFACEDNSFFGDGADYDCPILSSSEGGACQQNYTILMTDGFYNGGDPNDMDNEDQPTGDFSGGAFADSYDETLADVAMYFYKNDLSGLPDQVPTTSRDRLLYRGTGDLGEIMHQHMGTYTIGFGVNGTLTSMPSGPDDTSTSWPDPSTNRLHRIDDLRHAAYNGRGQFLSAGNPQELVDALNDVFEEIQQGVGTGSAVAFNTQNIRTDSVVFRAFYDTETNTGDLVAQEILADGTIDTSANLWSAAQELDNQTDDDSDSRNIITYDSANSAGIPFAWGDLTATQQTALHTPTRSNVTDADRTDNGGIGDERLEWVRGQSQHEGDDVNAGDLRDRPVTAGKLGDITHSSPVYVGAPEFSGRNGGSWPAVSPNTYAEFKESQLNRSPLVYVGANDGMLHAFRAEASGGNPAGSELFAYVPEFLQSGLPALADPEYNHRFFVDASPAINDIFAPSLSGGGWHTVLIGGAGAGGRGYFALDITNPGNFTDETTASNQVLWEFTNADDSDLGYTFSEPVITMSNADDGSGNKRWVAIFGNGYNSTAAAGDAKLFVAFIEEGQDGTWSLGSDYYKLNTGFGMAEYNSASMPHLDATTPNGIGDIRVIDSDGNGTADYVYAGDLQGHLMRFDLTNTSPSNWSYDGVLFQATYDDGDAATADPVQPITTAPIAVNHPLPGEPGFVIITATGSWMTNDDRTSEEIQSIYGIWDDLGNLNSTADVARDDLTEQTFTNEVDPVHGFVVRTSSDNPISWNNNGSNQERGWYIDLDMPAAGGSAGDPPEFPGERAVRNLQVRGDILFVNTIIPKAANPCESGPGGFELGLDPFSGSRPDKVVFDMNNDGVFDLNDNVDGDSSAENVVTGRRLEGGVPTDAGFIGNLRVTQVGDEVSSIRTNTETTGPIGRHSWREVVDE
ncbi:hypothetical protein H0Z60_05555 [Ectothiorhodospiraceae bacterium WFHF3C12]|nr:hypothetical protein [Ectothiorhodospiraceae bacterium WFHF3C12]